MNVDGICMAKRHQMICETILVTLGHVKAGRFTSGIEKLNDVEYVVKNEARKLFLASD